MIIAIDYDFTFTRDPQGWSAVMGFMASRGHEFICVTGRTEPPAPNEPPIPCPVICAGDEFKEVAAQKAGYKVDVWVDDMPGTIQNIPIIGE